MKKATKTVTFLASFPIKSGAVDFHGGDGARITLDIPEQNKAEALQLPAFFLGKVLEVTIKVKE